MKLALTLMLIGLTATLQTQTNPQTSSDLVVLKFSWTKYVMGSGLIHPLEADPAPGPIAINRDPIPRANDQRPASSPTQRHAEIATLERKAALSTNRSSTLYVIRIQVKNAGTKPIKSFVWAPEDPAGVPDLATRQFQCTVKTKPNDTKTLEIVSSLAPSPIVDANKAGDKIQKNPVPPVVINRIEFADGSVWQRSGWDPSILSQDKPSKSDGGKCVRL
jgi:hypothetical protein